MVAVAGWGSYLSIRSAASGPRWALAHLAGTRTWVAAAVGVGVFASLVVRPLWVGLSVVYVAVSVMFLAVLLRRSLIRLAESGGLEDLPLERRMAIVSRAKRMFAIAGGVLTLIGLAGIATGAGAIGWITGALGATLVITATAISVEADDG